jgi:hypothetical protein
MKRSIELKIKIKNLADEARTIRLEERKVRGMDRWNLQHHRKTVVRDAARRALIAYLTILGRETCHNAKLTRAEREGDRKEVCRLIRKYGDEEAVERLDAKAA